MNPEPALLIERHEAEWFRTMRHVPGVEVHDDPGVVWMVRPWGTSGNAGTHVRLTARGAPRQLDRMLERYRANGHGMGMWVAPAATPANLDTLLRERGLRCRKRYPAMLRTLDDVNEKRTRVSGIECMPIGEVDEFRATAYPSIGPLTTVRRRGSFTALATLTAVRPVIVRAFVARERGRPVASSLLFLGKECAGLHDLTVIESHRGRGIGGALLEHTCAAAVAHGATRMALISTALGEGVYRRAGFVEVARFAHWFRSFKPGSAGSRRR